MRMIRTSRADRAARSTFDAGRLREREIANLMMSRDTSCRAAMSAWIAFEGSPVSRRISHSRASSQPQVRNLRVASSRAAFASGQPYTQILGRGEIQVPSGFRWTFEERGELNGVRLPSYQRLDLAIQRRFTFKSWDMSAQLQVINVTNRKNIFNYFWSEGTAHKRKPGSRKEIAMLPMLPSFGIDFHF